MVRVFPGWHAMAPDPGRRAFLNATIRAAGAAMIAAAFAPPPARAAGQADALLLSCMDYRLTDDVERYMAGRGLRDKYDHVILAGASLGALTTQYPAWGTTFWEHLDVAIKLHGIRSVILLDHRDCGAYRVILGEDLARDPAKETAVHADHLRRLTAAIAARYPKLQVERLLMALDGKVEAVP